MNTTVNSLNTATAAFALPKPSFKILDNKGAQTGQIRNDNVTDDATPLLSGKGTPGSTITLYNHGNAMATVTVNSKGNWTYAPTLDDGNYSITIAVTDSAHGRSLSPTSSALNFTVQTKESVFVEKPTFTFNDDNGDEIEAGQETATRQPYLSGEGSVGHTIVITLNGKTYERLVEADENGNGTWQLVLSEEDALADGTYTMSIKAVDAEGNASATETISFTVAEPMEPVEPEPTEPVPAFVNVEAVVDSSGESIGAQSFALEKGYKWDASLGFAMSELGTGLTNVNTPTVRGTAAPGAIVTITAFNGSSGALMQTLTVQADPITGQWSQTLFEGMDLRGNGAPNDVYRFTASVEDTQNNTSLTTPIQAILLDNTAPSIPTLSVAKLEGDKEIKLEGSNEYRVSVAVEVWQDGVLIETLATAPRKVALQLPQQGWDYRWSASLPEGLPHGEYVIVLKATDRTGNTAQTSNDSYSLIVDAEGAHYRPFVLAEDQMMLNASVLPSDGSETLVVGKNATMQGKGQTGEGVVIVLYDTEGNPQHRLKTIVDAQGVWKVSMPDLTEGQWQAAIKKVSNGYQSVGEQVTHNFIVDITPPVLLASEMRLDGKALLSEDAGSLMTAAWPRLTGKGEAGATVTVLLTAADGTEATRSATVNHNGDWMVYLQGATGHRALAGGEWSMTITSQDTHGNISAPVQQKIVVDNVAPAMSTDDITIVTDTQVIAGITSRPVINDATPTITGKGEPGATVILHKLFYPEIAPYSTEVDADGNWSITVTSDAPLKNDMWYLTIIDDVGNEIPWGGVFTVAAAPVVASIADNPAKKWQMLT